MKILILAVFLVIITGCKMPVNNFTGVGEVIVENSKFDQALEVRMTKTHNFSGDEYLALSTQFSAFWTNSDPEHFILTLEMHGSASSKAYINFNSIKFNFSGEVINFEAGKTIHTNNYYNIVSNTLYTQSRAPVYLPYSVLEKMINQPEVRIRVLTSEGYEDIIYHVSDSSLKGYKYSKYYLAQFKKKVDSLI